MHVKSIYETLKGVERKLDLICSVVMVQRQYQQCLKIGYSRENGRTAFIHEKLFFFRYVVAIVCICHGKKYQCSGQPSGREKKEILTWAMFLISLFGAVIRSYGYSIR